MDRPDGDAARSGFDAHWQATADALSIHVNTLRRRIARVEQLTGPAVDTVEGRVDLVLALRNGEP